MDRTGARRCGAAMWIAVVLAGMAVADAADARDAPAPGCLDARTIEGAHLVAPREVLVRTADGGPARIHLLTDCPAPPEGTGVGALAPDGWMCAGGGAWVRSGDALCPVIAVQPLTEGEFADALRGADADADAIASLARVEVRGVRGRGFAGTTEYCVDSRHLRGWRTDAEGLVVEVSPMRHAGNRYYRVETATTCPDAESAATLRLVSNTGLAAICGHPGDRVVLGGSRPEHFAQRGTHARRLFGRGCQIRRVYPLPAE